MRQRILFLLALAAIGFTFGCVLGLCFPHHARAQGTTSNLPPPRASLDIEMAPIEPEYYLTHGYLVYRGHFRAGSFYPSHILTEKGWEKNVEIRQDGKTHRVMSRTQFLRFLLENH